MDELGKQRVAESWLDALGAGVASWHGEKCPCIIGTEGFFSATSWQPCLGRGGRGYMCSGKIANSSETVAAHIWLRGVQQSL